MKSPTDLIEAMYRDEAQHRIKAGLARFHEKDDFKVWVLDPKNQDRDAALSELGPNGKEYDSVAVVLLGDEHYRINVYFQATENHAELVVERVREQLAVHDLRLDDGPRERELKEEHEQER